MAIKLLPDLETQQRIALALETLANKPASDWDSLAKIKEDLIEIRHSLSWQGDTEDTVDILNLIEELLDGLGWVKE